MKGYEIMDLFNTDFLIAYCHYINEFQEFEKKLLPYIKTDESNRPFINNVFEISTGKYKIGCKKERKFYHENKIIIDNINSYMRFDEFICIIYDRNGNKFSPSIDNYILENKKDIDKILSVLEKLKELGFEDFVFESEDYTKANFWAQLYEEGDVGFSYVANMKITDANNQYIEYTTDDSNYVISFNTDNKRTSIHRKNISLNSLMFDPSTLPEKIDIEHTLGRILRLGEKFRINKNASTISLEDVTSKIIDLDKNASDLIRIIKDLGDDVNKDELLKYVEDIKSSILNAHHASKSVTLKRTKK